MTLMNGKFLLDTNIVIALFGNDYSVKKNIAKAEEIYIPVAVVGELYYGAFKSSKTEENLTHINNFIKANTILTHDAETSKKYGYVKHMLQKKGRPVPENDIWIAAIALHFNLCLISRDGHFLSIDNLQTASW